MPIHNNVHIRSIDLPVIYEYNKLKEKVANKFPEATPLPMIDLDPQLKETNKSDEPGRDMVEFEYLDMKNAIIQEKVCSWALILKHRLSPVMRKNSGIEAVASIAAGPWPHKLTQDVVVYAMAQFGSACMLWEIAAMASDDWSLPEPNVDNPIG